MMGMSQSTLAEKAGITPAAVSQILSGARAPSLDTVIRVMTVIPISFERLMKASTYERLSCKKAK
jgi:transcriptional regulator with XRE-family HTH domain